MTLLEVRLSIERESLIVASARSFVSVYPSALGSKAPLSRTIISLEAKKELTKIKKDTLELNKKVIEVEKSDPMLSRQNVCGNYRAPLKIQISLQSVVAHKKSFLTYQLYAASTFFIRA
jgi:hypothetical protein